LVFSVIRKTAPMVRAWKSVSQRSWQKQATEAGLARLWDSGTVVPTIQKIAQPLDAVRAMANSVTSNHLGKHGARRLVILHRLQPKVGPVQPLVLETLILTVVIHIKECLRLPRQ